MTRLHNSLRWLLPVFVTAALLMGGLGSLHARMQFRQAKKTALTELAAVARTKADIVAAWRTERLAEAKFYRANPVFTSLALSHLKKPTPQTERALTAWLEPVQKNHHYACLALLDTAGRIRFAVGDTAAAHSFRPDTELTATPKEADLIFGNLRGDPDGNGPYLDMLVQLRDETSGEVFGALHMVLDPSWELYPILMTEAMVTRSTETMLCQFAGDSGLFLSELKYRNGQWEMLRMPLCGEVAAALSARTGQGELEGLDHRGVPVLGFAQKVPDTPWSVVVKVDRAEIISFWKWRIWSKVGSVLLAILLLSLTFAYMLRRQQVTALRRESEWKSRHDTIVQRYEYLAQVANDAILLFNRGLQVVEVNQKATELYGYSPEEFAGLHARDLIAPEARASLEETVGQIDRDGAARYETEHFSKSGQVIPVEVSARAVDLAGGRFYLAIIRDIARRREFELRLRQSEENFRAIFENATVGMYRTAPDGTVLMANTALLKTLGYDSLEELKSRSVPHRGYYRAEDATEFLRLMEEEGTVIGLETQWRKRDGSPVWVRESARAVKDDAGKVLYYEGTVENITARVEVQQSLERAVRALKVLSECNKLMVRTDDEGEFLKGVCRILVDIGGYRLAWVGMANDDDMQSIVPAASAGFEQGYLEGLRLTWAENERGRGPTGTAIREGRAVVCRDIAHDPRFAPWREDALSRGYRSTLALPLMKEGKALGAINIYASEPNAFSTDEIQLLSELADDVTFGLTAMRTRREHLRTEEVFRILVENHFNGVYLMRGRRYEYVNPEFCRITGYSSAELTSPEFDWSVLLPDAARQVVEQRYADRLAGKAVPDEYRLTLLRKDGSEVIVDTATKMVAEMSTPAELVVLGIVRDVTSVVKAEEARHNLESQLIAAQRMETVGRLAGGVAHDFNNLLTVIGGVTELAMTSLKPEDPLYNDIQEIHKAYLRAADLTRQLLAFSRRQPAQPRILDLNQVIANMDRMLKRIIGEDIALVTVPGEGLKSVLIDQGQFEQVITNLVVNARDAMAHGGRLTIETANVELDEEYCRTHASVPPGSYVMVAVSDTGEGMTDEIKAHIFEPFFTTKPAGKGTGLGLSTVYGIVKQHHGHIWVYSEPGRGTSFKIYLPAVSVPTETVTREEAEPEQLYGTGTILVVEDEDAVRDMAVRILKKYGYEVLETRAPGDAYMLCKEFNRKVDLVLTDVVMPHINGPQLVALLRATWPDLKVLYMSGYTANAIVHDGILDPGIPYLQKPFRPVDLARRVKQILTAFNP